MSNNLVKRTYSLPRTIATLFEEWVEPGKRSSVVATLLEEFADTRRKHHLRQAIIEGCSEMQEVYLELEGEFQPLEEEVHCALNN